MIKEAIGLGSTIDEAKENAILNLNASEEDDVQFEIISMPKKKVLGLFGGAKAEVKAFVELPDRKQKPKKKNPPKTKGKAKKEKRPKNKGKRNSRKTGRS